MASIGLPNEVTWFGSHWAYRAITDRCIPRISDPALRQLLQDSRDANICGADLRDITPEQRAEYTAAVIFAIENAKEDDFREGFYEGFLKQAGYLRDLLVDPANAVYPYETRPSTPLSRWPQIRDTVGGFLILFLSLAALSIPLVLAIMNRLEGR